MWLRDRGVPFRFVTNITRMPKSSILSRLRRDGIPVAEHEVITALVAGAVTLTEMGAGLVAPFVSPETLGDLEGFELCGGTSQEPARQPDAVLLGDLGRGWSVELLNEAFRYVLEGAKLVALQKNRFWMGPQGREMDAGPFVAAIEYASGSEAVICGKPRKQFFDAALKSMGIELNESGDDLPAMIGDDLWGDVSGAQEAGLQGWLVRTGKFRQADLETSGVKPDRVLDSIADIINL